MKRIALAAVAVGLLALAATPALADNQPTARDIEAAVDSYLANAESDANLVGGPGSAGYDSGFWIRGGDFTLRINLTLQARFEYFRFDDDEGHPTIWGDDVNLPTQDIDDFFIPGGGDLSGFSLPRALLKFSGTAPCNMRYYVEFDFGHHGGSLYGLPWLYHAFLVAPNSGVFLNQTYQYTNTREAWIEWGMSDSFNFRMGQILYPNMRQLMTAPELQQFVDISMASSIIGILQPGYTDRNRDFGLMLHGTFGCKNEWQYMFAVTNGDGGDSLRNVMNTLTSDNFMYSGRINWAFLEPIGYTEGATRFNSCTWYGEIGVWGSYYADRFDKPHVAVGDRAIAGLDLALGYGGFSLNGSFTWFKFKGSDLGIAREEWYIGHLQLGYMFPGTAWEIAARGSYYERKIGSGNELKPTTTTFGAGINYYLNGHSNKLQLDFTWIKAEADGEAGGGYMDVYPGVPLGFNSDGSHMLFRFQWQLAL